MPSGILDFRFRGIPMGLMSQKMSWFDCFVETGENSYFASCLLATALQSIAAVLSSHDPSPEFSAFTKEVVAIAQYATKDQQICIKLFYLHGWKLNRSVNPNFLAGDQSINSLIGAGQPVTVAVQ